MKRGFQHLPTMYGLLDPDGDLCTDYWGNTALYATRKEAEERQEEDEVVVEVALTIRKEVV